MAPRPLGRHGRLVAAVMTAAALVLLAAACTRSPSSNGPAGSPNAHGSANPSTVAYSACMRSHGVPGFPDPDSSGQLPKPDAHHLGVSSSQLQAAQRACQPMLRDNGGAINSDSVQLCMMADDCPQALVQQVRNEELSFAQCMRSNGVPNWPDPILDSQGRPVFAISIGRDGFNPYSKQIWAKGNACSHLMPDLPGAPFQVSP